MLEVERADEPAGGGNGFDPVKADSLFFTRRLLAWDPLEGGSGGSIDGRVSPSGHTWGVEVGSISDVTIESTHAEAQTGDDYAALVDVGTRAQYVTCHVQVAVEQRFPGVIACFADINNFIAFRRHRPNDRLDLDVTIGGERTTQSISSVDGGSASYLKLHLLVVYTPVETGSRRGHGALAWIEGGEGSSLFAELDDTDWSALGTKAGFGQVDWGGSGSPYPRFASFAVFDSLYGVPTT